MFLELGQTREQRTNLALQSVLAYPFQRIPDI